MHFGDAVFRITMGGTWGTAENAEIVRLRDALPAQRRFAHDDNWKPPTLTRAYNG
jgi:hypothetical protein